MARRCALAGAILIFFLCLMPDPLLAARLELRELGSGASDLEVMVGDEIEVSLWVDSDGLPISGAAVFLSFDETVFDLVDEDRQPAVAGFQPFAPGDFLGNGEIFRNALLDPTDPAAAAAGEQLDYSVVRALDQGSGRAATFRLRVRTPAAGTTIRIDENGYRETRFFTPDGHHQAFRFITPLSVRVRGIGIEGLPERLVLRRGQTDTTTFRLDELIFDPVYGPGEIDWSVTAGSQIAVERLAEGNLLRVVAPETASPWERITVTATNPDGQSASAFVDVFVNAAPELPGRLGAVTLQEDHIAEVSLADVVSDPDTPVDRLTWSVTAPDRLGATVSGSPPVLHLSPAPDWHGSAEVTLYAVDDYGFADTAAVSVTVSPTNDAPRILVAPNLRLTRGRTDSTLVLAGLLADVEDGPAGLRVRWSGQHHVGIEVRSGRLLLSAPPVWIGEEIIQLEVEDSGGLAATAPLTVTVVRSLAPSLLSPPERLGLAAGDYAVVDLAEFAVDPDDGDADLTWSVSGSQRLQVQLSSGGGARIEAPGEFTLPEILRFTVADPSGETATFELLVFPASPDGAPAIAPLPEIALPAGGVDASIDLDDYVFDLDHQPADMEWFLPALDGMTLRVDPTSHVLTVAVADSAAPGATTLQLRVRDPDGLEAVQSLTLRIAAGGTSPGPGPDPGALPVLASLPTLTLRAGEFDQSIDLDEYVSGIDPSQLSWQASGQEHLQVFVDPGTRQVTVLAETGWSGPEIVVLRGTDVAGNVVEGLLGVQVLAPVSELKLRDLTEAAVFAGDSAVVLDAAALLDGPADPGQLVWSVRSPASLTATYLVSEGSLVIAGSAFAQPGSQLVDLVARDSSGAEAAGRVLLQVYPIDGSHGTESEALRVAVVPNAVQPDYLDVFVLSHVGGAPPRLRMQKGEWSDMALDNSGAGIWQGRHVLQPGLDGSVRFLALAMGPDWHPLTADFAIQVATARPGAGKRVAMAGTSVDFGADAFAAETVVALMPAEVESVGDELVAAGEVMVVYATRPFAGHTVRVGLAGTAPGAAVYRWDEGNGRWSYLGGESATGDLAVASTRLGRFAALSDVAAPRLVERQVDAAGVRLRWSDGGSGIAEVSVSVDARRLPEAAYTWDGAWLAVDGDWVSSGALSAEVTDRAGNRARVVVDLAATRPRAFALGHNYPNPFNPTTTIPLEVAAGLGRVRVEVYNAAGQRVRLLVDGTLSPGEHDLVWDGCDGAGRAVSSGVYFCRAVVGNRAATRKMTLSR